MVRTNFEIGPKFGGSTATRNGDSQTASATYNNGAFEASIALKFENMSYSKNEWEAQYVYSVSYRMGTDKISNGKIMECFPSRDLYSRIKSNNPILFKENTHNSRETVLVIQPYLSNYFGTNDKLKFISCKMYVTHNGEVLEIVDLMNKLTSKDGVQSLDYGEPTRFSYEDAQSNNSPLTVPTMPINSDGWYGPNGEVYIIATDAYGFEYVF
ncbi:MAG: hypothetical protein FWD30_03670 [Dehalococcoidia bacterium]|nr:hypothetical protein [Dehalococcoidia bacterium]